jgi:hypothetical protein
LLAFVLILIGIAEQNRRAASPDVMPSRGDSR